MSWTKHVLFKCLVKNNLNFTLNCANSFAFKQPIFCSHGKFLPHTCHKRFFRTSLSLCMSSKRAKVQTESKPSFKEEVVQNDLRFLHKEINQILYTNTANLNRMCNYYFDGEGKSFRPKVVFLISRAYNIHIHDKSFVSENQRKVALIAEMIHVGSLIHDDVVDFSDVRRGKMSVNSLCGDRNAVMTGNYVVSNASCLMSTICRPDVTVTISQIIEDIVRGEFMQQDNLSTFDHYLKKTYKKTASLLANCCKAAVQLSSESDKDIEAAYEFGRNIGIAFQLIDDLLDFVASSDALGKPAAVDMKLGLATAPVLFASETHSQLQDMILRRFRRNGDVEQALKLVANSGAIEETRLLAQNYCNDAIRCLDHLKPSPEKTALIKATDVVLTRTK